MESDWIPEGALYIFDMEDNEMPAPESVENEIITSHLTILTKHATFFGD